MNQRSFLNPCDECGKIIGPWHQSKVTRNMHKTCSAKAWAREFRKQYNDRLVAEAKFMDRFYDKP